MNPLMQVTRNQFVSNLSQARQTPLTQLPPWAQSGLYGWMWPQANENLALIFDISRIGLTHIIPVLDEIRADAYDLIRGWITGKFWSTEDDVADLVEQWAEGNWPDDVWAEDEE